MNTELLEALNILEKEKDISKETLLDAIENSLMNACKNHFGTSDNIKIVMDRKTCDYSVYAEREVVEEVFDPAIEISLEDAEKINPALHIGDIAQVELHSKEFGRIATQNAKNVILQKIREEERKVIYDEYFSMEKEVVTGVVQRYVGRNVSINLGKADALLTESEQIKGETFQPTERIKVYILEVKARIKAIMRRVSKRDKNQENEKVIVKGEMKIDCESRRVIIGEKEINLTAKEFDLLELLAMNPGKVYSRENLLNIVWGYEYPGDARTVDVHIRRLREKIETNPSDPKYVYTKWGVGYYFRG